MSTALMPISSTPGRPSVITIDGCSHYISVHDEWHRAEVKRHKQRMRDLHPDRRWWTKRTLPNEQAGGTIEAKRLRDPESINPFLNAQRQFDWFMKQEIRFYRSLGLSLPDSEDQQYVPQVTQQRKALSGKTGSGKLGGRWNTRRSL